MIDSTTSTGGEMEDAIVSVNRLLSTLFVDKELRQKFHICAVDFIHEELPEEKTEYEEKCPICLEHIPQAAIIKSIKCKHKFHNLCLLSWMYKKPTCPVCRTYIPPR